MSTDNFYGGDCMKVTDHQFLSLMVDMFKIGYRTSECYCKADKANDKDLSIEAYHSAKGLLSQYYGLKCLGDVEDFSDTLLRQYKDIKVTHLEVIK